MRKFSDKANARLVFRQGYKNASYLLHLYDLFQEYVLTPPKISTCRKAIKIKKWKFKI